MVERSADWLAQAQRDLQSAAYQRDGGFYEWAAFAAQQGAEKAIKAVFQRWGGDAWGYSCFQLLRGLFDKHDRGLDLGSAEQQRALLDAGRLLDRFYIPARYPNGWDAGAPKDLITAKDAADALAAADEILRLCQSLLA